MTYAADYTYELPPELVAQTPGAERHCSRMMALDRASASREIRGFDAIVEYLRPGDCLVINDTKVIPARLLGSKGGTGAKVEALLVSQVGGGFGPDAQVGGRWRAMLRPAKRLRPGTRVELSPRHGQAGGDSFTVIERLDDGEALIDFGDIPMELVFQRYGHVPLPPYIRRDDTSEDIERYQTVFAAAPGAVAAPTAGLHFTPEIIAAIKEKGVGVHPLTLHVGPGTFKPVAVDDIREHRMHSEWFDLEVETAAAANSARESGGRIIAVGTTVVRVLETCAQASGELVPRRGETDIFIHPPYQFRAVDALLTNFHLPASTLLMLVCAFAGRETVLTAYEDAKAAGMRFFSYGDCMFIS